MFCDHPERAYASHLPEFLGWITEQPRKEAAKLYWRNTPTFSTIFFGCKRRNSAFAWANQFAHNLVAGYGIEYLDFWSIEAARYADTCHEEREDGWHRDQHYSCCYEDFSKVQGVVGEAVARTFMHMMAMF
eukprot:TRINITY_DN4801_c0_g2_i1.p2 TRINITY_DN4801_c0_g2~~TRINITY_DN4801_c0_g2_i1.p2  ORF type:complete len:131 (+),score=18.56 TRINITY_DN4801_c0_g2_i1:242-634(+)